MIEFADGIKLLKFTYIGEVFILFKSGLEVIGEEEANVGQV